MVVVVAAVALAATIDCSETTRGASERTHAHKHPLACVASCRSWDEFISNSYFSSSFAFFFFFFFCLPGSGGRDDGTRNREREGTRKKKIVHPIADARGRSEFCRLACAGPSDAGGHDWSKTENKQIEKRETHSAHCTLIKSCSTNRKQTTTTRETEFMCPSHS